LNKLARFFTPKEGKAMLGHDELIKNMAKESHEALVYIHVSPSHLGKHPDKM